MSAAAEMDPIRVERLTSGVRVVTIDRPPVNALRFADLADLDTAFAEIAADDAARCVVITGAGQRAFLAGTDLAELTALTADTADVQLEIVKRLVARVAGMPVPVICALNGPALGSGVAIVACADIRVAAPRGALQLPEVDVGVMGGARHLARILPQGTVRLAMYTGRRIGAQELHRLGAVDLLVEQDELLPRALELAEEIAGKPAVAIRYAKRAFDLTEELPLAEAYPLECELTAALRREPEAVEAGKRYMARIGKR